MLQCRLLPFRGALELTHSHRALENTSRKTPDRASPYFESLKPSHPPENQVCLGTSFDRTHFAVQRRIANPTISLSYMETQKSDSDLAVSTKGTFSLSSLLKLYQHGM